MRVAWRQTQQLGLWEGQKFPAWALVHPGSLFASLCGGHTCALESPQLSQHLTGSPDLWDQQEESSWGQA